MLEAVAELFSSPKPPVAPPTDAEEFARISSAIEAVRAERGKITAHGTPEDTAFGQRLAALEAELRPIKDRMGMRALHPVPVIEVEDPRIGKARADLADTERDLVSDQENLAAQRVKLGKLEREAGSATDRVKAASAITAAESDVRVAMHRVDDARQRLLSITSLVREEQQAAARAAVVEAAAPLLSAGKEFLEARERYIVAREAAAHAGIHAAAPPSTFTRERLAEFAQALSGLI